MKKSFSVAIDGPSGAGKSTIAKLCAEKLGFLYVDTGAMYRTVGLAVMNAGIHSMDSESIAALLPKIKITIEHDEKGMQRMMLDGKDVSSDIRSPQVSIYASDVSSMPVVRTFLHEMQRELASANKVIMDGRDIGTVLLPDADLKIFLTADASDRAQRRYVELLLRGVKATYEEVLEDINYRDENDKTRSAAPLRAAEDAIVIDTTGYSLEHSFAYICGLIEDKMLGP